MKILIWSTAPWVSTGYGKNCKHLIKAFKELGHEVSVLATYGLLGGELNSNGVKILPSNNNFWHMGEAVKYWEDKLNPDLIVQHFDIWTVQPDFIKTYEIKTPILTYTPVDAIPVSKSLIASANGAADNVAMSQFAHQSFHEAGMISQSVIPHMVDTNIYHPFKKDEARRKLGLPEDKFIIGSVGTNKGPRKNIGGQLFAYSKALKDKNFKENSIFYLHTYMVKNEYNMEGFDLHSMIEYLGIEDNIAYTDPIQYFYGLSEYEMAILYSSFDILTECSYGEGFGIPIIEAQACGVPVIGTNFSAIPEVIGFGGTLIPTEEAVFFQSLGVRHAIPSTDDIAEAYLKYFYDSSFKEGKVIESCYNAERYNFENWINNWGNHAYLQS